MIRRIPLKDGRLELAKFKKSESETRLRFSGLLVKLHRKSTPVKIPRSSETRIATNRVDGAAQDDVDNWASAIHRTSSGFSVAEPFPAW